MSKVKEIDFNDFKKEVVEFWAPWRMPCKALLPKIDDDALDTKKIQEALLAALRG